MNRTGFVIEPSGLALLGVDFEDAWSELEARMRFTSDEEREAARNEIARMIISLRQMGTPEDALDRDAIVEAFLTSHAPPGMAPREPGADCGER